MATSAPIRVAVSGASGRMGLEVCRCVTADPRLATAALLTSARSAKRTGLGGAEGLSFTTDIAGALAVSDVVIDFSSPGAIIPLCEALAQTPRPLVSGTTGILAPDMERLKSLSAKMPVLHSPNMSVGVQALLALLELAVKQLGPSYDVEIVESHHRHKKDAPSGTAKLLAGALDAARALQMPAPRAIPVHALRGGDVVGDHTVYFMGDGDRLELTHRATSRHTFAVGAVRAARWIVGRPPGWYAMQDVLSETHP